MNAEEEQVLEHEAKWGRDREHYMLDEVKDDAGHVTGHLILDLRTNHAVIIENNRVAREVKRRMLAAGVPVGDSSDLQLRKEIIRARLERAKGSRE